MLLTYNSLDTNHMIYFVSYPCYGYYIYGNAYLQKELVLRGQKNFAGVALPTALQDFVLATHGKLMKDV